MNRDSIPSVHFYDQDFVDLYDRSWVWIDEYWKQGTEQNGFAGNYVSYADRRPSICSIVVFPLSF